jgi:hypothetical protein
MVGIEFFRYNRIPLWHRKSGSIRGRVNKRRTQINSAAVCVDDLIRKYHAQQYVLHIDSFSFDTHIFLFASNFRNFNDPPLHVRTQPAPGNERKKIEIKNTKLANHQHILIIYFVYLMINIK